MLFTVCAVALLENCVVHVKNVLFVTEETIRSWLAIRIMSPAITLVVNVVDVPTTFALPNVTFAVPVNTVAIDGSGFVPVVFAALIGRKSKQSRKSNDVPALDV